MTLGEALKQVKENTKMSVRGLAVKIGVSPYRLQKWVDKSINPKHDDTEKILRFFDIPSLTNLSEEVLNSTIIKLNGPVIINEKNVNETADPGVPYHLQEKKGTVESFLEVIKEQLDIIKLQQQTIHHLATKGGDETNQSTASM